ncbi:MAG TPA: ribose-5-phosphate isomerase RpiA [Candidatus Solibacter sp.]|jgi:ribose 5-phosphate isomerase A|nr:ribose-5-phosphate isomerase RpiA [Candidatus Solibacter sp.]
MEPKQAAALRALEEVEDGMLLGLGTGSTAVYYIEALAERVRNGLSVTAVATSRASAELAAAGGVTLLESIDRPIDLTVDGADEIDPALNLVKGLGGAMLREKVVAAASLRMVVIATEEKLVPRLGRGPLPVEVLPLLWERTAETVRGLGLEPRRREVGGVPFVSDNGNLILDCTGADALDVRAVGATLDSIPGVLGHGLFMGIATEAIVAGSAGVRMISRM